MVTKTFHGAGIVVPVDKNDVGYRELPETDGEFKFQLLISFFKAFATSLICWSCGFSYSLAAGLKKICKAIVEARNDEERVKAFGPVQEIITFVQFANDECDYGMGYELGIDLFCYGSHVSF